MEISKSSGDHSPNRISLGNGSVTDSDSKTVMITAERGDIVTVKSIESTFIDTDIPEEFEVLRRTEPYYGPKLLMFASVNDDERNFLLTAPGPLSQLKLWIDDLAASGKRQGWIEAAEVTASLAVEQPPYERCPECGEMIRSIEHERASISGLCDRKQSLD